MATIQGIYIAMFGRPADPEGLKYWNEQTNNGQNLTSIIANLSSTDEYKGRFTNKTPEEIVSSIYKSLFAREPEAEGLKFFSDALKAGTYSIAQIAVAVLDGAQGADKAIIDNKLAAAALFTSHIDTQVEIDGYKGNTAADNGRTFLSKITSDKATIPTEADVDKVIASIVTAGGQAPDDNTNNNDNSVLPYKNSYGLLADTAQHPPRDGSDFKSVLFVGQRNPADQFTLSKNDTAHLELGLDVRYKNVGIDVNPVNGLNVYQVTESQQGELNFAYSVASVAASADEKPLRLDLTKYDITLSIDTDPTAGTKFVTFKLVDDFELDDKSVRGFQTSIEAIKKLSSQYSWIASDDRIWSDDDGGDRFGWVTQNIKSFLLFQKEALKAGSSIDYVLDAYEKGTSNVVAHDTITVNVVKDPFENSFGKLNAAAQTPGGTLFIANDSPQSDEPVYNLPADGFFLSKNNAAGIELGLNARLEDDTQVQKATLGNYFQLDKGELGSVGFDFSVASTNNTPLADYLNKYEFVLSVDSDPSLNTRFTELHLNSTAKMGPDNQMHQIYTWAELNGLGMGPSVNSSFTNKSETVSQGFYKIGDYLSEQANVLEPQYEIKLDMYSKADHTLLAHTAIVVDLVGNAPAIAQAPVIFVE